MYLTDLNRLSENIIYTHTVVYIYEHPPTLPLALKWRKHFGIVNVTIPVGSFSSKS